MFKIQLLIVVFSSLCNQVASCHAVAGGQPPLQLTLSASPASTTTHLWHTVTFHCPPATNHTPGGRLLSRILAAHSSSLRDRPALAASPRADTGPHLDPKYPGCFSVPQPASGTVHLLPGNLGLLHITAGETQAPSEGSAPSRGTQDLPSSCPADGRPPLRA